MRAERRNTMRLGALAAATVALALLIPAGQAASAHTSARTTAAKGASANEGPRA